MFPTQLLTSLCLAVVFASGTLAAPWPQHTKLGTHRQLRVRDLTLEAYHPETQYQTFGSGLDHANRKRSNVTIEDAAKAFVETHSGSRFAAANIECKTWQETDTVRLAYMKQTHNGIPVANAVANVAFNKDDKVVAYGSSFVQPTQFAPSTPSLAWNTAVSNAESLLDGKYNDHPGALEYVMQQDGSAALTHVVQVKNNGTGSWYEAFVDAHNGNLVSVTDFVAEATYRVLPIAKQAPTEGFETLQDPEDLSVSPFGWLRTSKNGKDATSTQGNNAVAFIGNRAAAATAPGQFVFTQNPAAQPTNAQNMAAAITNAFFIVNTVHDIAYKYGFTEKAFNFQQSAGAGTGGRAGDPVLISVQDASGTNNANFATPGDGQSGEMRMFLWTLTNPQRDGALENDIVVHEMTHGITNRMTGGGTGRCLQTTEARGLGEGWSDAMADWTEQKTQAAADFTMGTFVINDPKGIRSAPYSTDAKVNPLTFASVAALNEEHNIGEVWANMLHNVYAALVAEKGFSEDAFTDPTSPAGNAVFLHLMLDALQLQPCNPTFLTARDAWIQADANRFAGANECTVRKAFASRGLGSNAKNFVDDFSVPAKCQ